MHAQGHDPGGGSVLTFKDALKSVSKGREGAEQHTVEKLVM